MRKILFSMVMLCFAFFVNAQIVETTPAILQQSSSGVVITYHADQGNKGLKGYNGEMYCHTGVITSKSNGSWSHTVTPWPSSSNLESANTEKNRLTKVAEDTWQLNIGNIREYYNITDPEEVVLRLAFVFRGPSGSPEGKTETGGDIFVDVFDDAFNVSLASDASSYILQANSNVTFTAVATEACKLEITVNGQVIKSAENVTSLSASYAFEAAGQYTVAAVADNGTDRITDEINYLYLNATAMVDYPGGEPRMGAVENADGSVTFCLAAPLKDNVLIVGSWNDYAVGLDAQMNCQELDGVKYFWTTVDGLDRDTYYCYYYIVDGAKKVADPYAHLVLDPYSDKWLKKDNLGDIPQYPYDLFDDTFLAVYKGSLDEYDWKVTDFQIPNHDELIIYEMLFRDFTGRNNTDDGTIAEARKHMEYLRRLGVNAIELMPIMEFNGNNSWGYNTNFYMAPDKAYGTPDEYKEFIDLCHEYGFAVILDIVFNQSDGNHPWYQMYPRDANPFYNANAPHDYSVLNDWKQEYPLVQKHWEDVLRYWMTEYNVDGFRFDLVKGLGDSDSYGAGTEAYNASRVANMTRLHAVLTSVNPNAIHINEHLAGAKEENEMAADGQLNWMNLNNNASQIAMGWTDGSECNSFYAPKASRTVGSTISYAESHDEHRMGYKQVKWGRNDVIKGNLTVRMQRLGLSAALMLMMPGSHMIWQYQELGADENTKNEDGSNNTSPKKVVMGYLDDPERAGLYETYCQLNLVRKNNRQLFTQDAFVNPGFSIWDNGYTLTLLNGDDEIAVLANPNVEGSLPVSVNVSKIANGNCQVMAATWGYVPVVNNADGSVSVDLPAGHFVVLGTGRLNGLDVADGIANPNVTVSGANGQITILGDYNRAEVYNLAGQRQNSLNVASGVYIVNVDGTAHKVVVR